MPAIKLMRNNGKPGYYDPVVTGASEDFLFIADNLFPAEDITAVWEPVSNCFVTATVVENDKIIDGTTYRIVITARINMFVAPLAETKLTLTGITSSQDIPVLLNIPVTQG